MENQEVVKGSGYTMTPAVVDRPSSPEPAGKEDAVEKKQQLEPLFARSETEDFRADWHQIQGDFVDEPKLAVERADKLVATVIHRLASQFAAERKRLEQGWSNEGEV